MNSLSDSRVSDGNSSFSYSSYGSENCSSYANEVSGRKAQLPPKIQNQAQKQPKQERADSGMQCVSLLEFNEMERQMKQYQTDFHEAEETIDALEQSLKAVLLAVSNVTRTQVRTIDDALRLISEFASGKSPSNESERVKSLTEQLSSARQRILELQRTNDTLNLQEKLSESESRVALLSEKFTSVTDLHATTEKNVVQLKKKLSKVIEENQSLKAELKSKKSTKTTAKGKGKGRAVGKKGKKAAPATGKKKKQSTCIVEERKAEMLSLETRIKELQYELETARDTLRSPESSLSSESYVSSILMNEQVLAQFEELCSAQNTEIQELYLQRNKLLELAKTLEDNVEEAEETLEQTHAENEKLVNDIEIARNDVEIQEKNNEITIQQIRNHVVEMLPQCIASKIQLVQSLKPEKQIIEYFRFVIDELANKIRQERENVSDAKMPYVLAQLENALRFIKNLSNSIEVRPLLADEKFKRDIFAQIKEIQEFVDSQPKNELQAPSVFDARESDNQIKAFVQIAEDVNESPIRELFALFSGVVIVNKMLFQKIKLLEPLRKVVDQKRLEYTDMLTILQDEALKQDQLTQTLVDLVDNPSNSFYEMVDELIGKYLENVHLKTESLKDLQNIKKEVSQIEKRTNISAAEQSKKYEDQIRTLKTEIKLLTDKITSIQAENRNYTSKLINASNSSVKVELEATKIALDSAKEKIEILRSHKANAKILDKKCSDLEGEKASILSQLSDITTKKEIAEKVGNQVKAENAKLIANKKKITEENKAMKEEIAALRKINGQILEDIKSRNANLSDRLEGRLKEMEKSVEQANVKYDEAESIKSEFLSAKKDYQQQIAKLKASERTFKVRIEELEKRNELIKQQAKSEFDAQILTARTQTDQEFNSTKDFVVCCCKRLVQLIESNFLITIGGEIDLWDIVNILEEQLHNISTDELAIVAHDNAKARSVLAINNQDLVWEATLELKNALDHEIETNKDLFDHIKELEKEINQLKTENQDLFETRLDANDWEQWAKDIYQVVNNGAASENYRKAIEEMLLGGSCNKTIARKLSILRAEKAIFKTNSDAIESIPSSTSYSIRPQIIAFMFIRRLQVCSDTLPVFIQMKPQRN